MDAEMKTNLVILPMDGFFSEKGLLGALAVYHARPLMHQLVGVVKYNDALHIPYVGPAILEMASDLMPADAISMIDLKLADVSATNGNILRLRYASYNPGIVTVTSTVSAKSLMVIKDALPNTKIAIVDTLTDIGDEEILDRYGMLAADKITHALRHFDKRLGSDNPVDQVVCSPKELPRLVLEFGNRYEFITPGIRSPHMAADHQQRTTSVYDALKAGGCAKVFPVIGAQLTKGNPDTGISPEQSQQITYNEILQYYAELKAA